MPIPGTVPLSGPIAPSSTADTYPVTDPQYGLGGMRSVDSLSQRDAIPAERRQPGMIVYVSGLGEWYALGNDGTTWSPFKPGSDLPVAVTSPVEGDLLTYRTAQTKFVNERRDDVVAIDGGNF